MRKITLSIILTALMLVSCSGNDKTVVLNDDTSKDENTRYSVTSENFNVELKSGHYYTPSFFEGNDIYGYQRKADEYESGVRVTKYSPSNNKTIIGEEVGTDKIHFIDNAKNTWFDRNYVYYDMDEMGSHLVYEDEYLVDSLDGTMKQIKWSESSEEYVVEFTSNSSSNSYNNFVSGNNNYIYSSVLGQINNIDGDRTRKFSGCTLRLYDFNEEKSYYMGSSMDDKEFVVIENILYSNKRDKLIGLNRFGDVYELNLSGDKIEPTLLYKIPIGENERIQVIDSSPNENIITGERLIFSTYRVPGTGEDENIERYASTSVSVLNLEKLIIEDLDELKFKEDNIGQIFKFESGLAIVEIKSELANNEYAILDLRSDNIEIITTIKHYGVSGITYAICDDEGKNIVISGNDNSYSNKQQITKFSIERIY
ncbi:MAG: hypothetical protein RR620_07980 [Clostridium sp.]